MNRLKAIPLIFLLTGGAFGLLMRLHLHHPLSWVKFPYWLHAHSHLLILGWILNSLLLFYIDLFVINGPNRVKYRITFTSIQFVLVLLAVSFVLQGYGTFSIILSVVHLAMTTAYFGWIHRDTRHQHDLAYRVLRLSLLLFAISALGPLMLGPLSALGLSNTKWKSYLVHFYLHFLIDGAFLFGVLAIFIRQLAIRAVAMDERRWRSGVRILFISIFPAYLLGIIDTTTPRVLFLIGAAGAVLQTISLFILYRSFGTRALDRFQGAMRHLFFFGWSCLVLKTVLQLVVVLPDAAIGLLTVRQMIVAYLHLVLVGFLTSFLVGCHIETRGNERQSLIATRLFICAFVGIESGLVLQAIPRSPPFDISMLILVSSLMLWFSLLLFLLRIPVSKKLVLTST